ncbi:TlpA family protein disulfide reductase [Winogradskyella psychrotolerans]|uniref:TlpA family protein disulfide reductase n=1 Tax=Winogradskyella psychrotolerans TaxID=1344585 RepID=UPI001C077B91|nr:thioredoxin family protein [Winogradskyella psychrotolerans]MBU2929255.1 thioredoxin family protein [Winogradskyella psychrotolerans]
MKTNNFLILITLTIVFQSHAQHLNQEITNEGETPFLLGKIDKQGLEGDHYKSWFTTNYENYQPNSEQVPAITSELKNYTITLFLGTWCGDSQREVPKFYKVLDACEFPMEQLTVVAVSRQANMYKQSPQHEEKGLNIHRVPTIIFYKNGKEVNRIVEHPIGTFEDDILNIITVNNYKSNYQIVTAVDQILKKKGIKGLKQKSKKLIKTFEGNVSSMFELNTYGKILYTTNSIDEAIAVFKLNTKLFPNEPRVFMSLANTLGVFGNKMEAIKVLEEAIKLHPDHKDLKENLELVKSN